METITRSFVIVLAKQVALVAELNRLAKRAAKIGAPAITWSFGEVEQRAITVHEVGEAMEVENGLGGVCVIPAPTRDRVRMVPFIHLTVTGIAPKIAGWEFAATIQHIEEDVNILRSIPREEAAETARPIPDSYRTRGPVCDHCKSIRMRRDTYLVVSEAGEWKQVGSSCLVDFFGHKDPNTLAEYAEIFATVVMLADCAEEDEGSSFGGGGASRFAIVEYLTCVAAEIREGGWTPKSAIPDAPQKSTAMMAKDRMAPGFGAMKRDRSVTDGDLAVATAAYEWALALNDSGEHLGDYLWNLYAVAKGGVVDYRRFGLAASMVAAHTKAEVRKRERALRKPSEHVGSVGESRSFALTLDRHFSFDGDWGHVDRYIFKDADGNVFTWKSSGDATVIGADYANRHMVEGSTYILTASIKKHDQYKDTKQTVLTRAGVRLFHQRLSRGWSVRQAYVDAVK